MEDILKVREEQKKDFKEAFDMTLKPRRGKNFAKFVKPFQLLNGYLWGKKFGDSLQSDLTRILKKTP